VERQLAAVDAELAGLRDRRGELSRSQKRLEDEVAGLEEKQTTIERRLATGTVPRELQSLAEERDSLKRRQTHLEDELLEIMELSEPVDAAIARLEESQGALDERVLALRSVLAAEEGAIEAEMAELAGQRAGMVGAVPAALLAEYDRLREKLGGVAVAPLVSGSCGGCHLKLPATELDRIKRQAPDEIAHCEQCGRILVRA
jgi:predicted  nucleic acid-binding Zn-ribbon protein